MSDILLLGVARPHTYSEEKELFKNIKDILESEYSPIYYSTSEKHTLVFFITGYQRELIDAREVSEEISQELLDSFATMFTQEKDLDELGIEQNFTLDPTECVTAMRNGMTDIMRSLLHYIDVQRMANTLIAEDEE